MGEVLFCEKIAKKQDVFNDFSDTLSFKTRIKAVGSSANNDKSNNERVDYSLFPNCFLYLSNKKL